MVDPEVIQRLEVIMVSRWDYILDGTSFHHQTSNTHSFTLGGSLDLPVHFLTCFGRLKETRALSSHLR